MCASVVMLKLPVAEVKMCGGGGANDRAGLAAAALGTAELAPPTLVTPLAQAVAVLLHGAELRLSAAAVRLGESELL